MFPPVLGCAGADPIRLMDPDPDLALNPDPTPFFNDFKKARKKIFFFIIFSFNLLAGTLSSILKI
jgi:hypothetical protein